MSSTIALLAQGARSEEAVFARQAKDRMIAISKVVGEVLRDGRRVGRDRDAISRFYK